MPRPEIKAFGDLTFTEFVAVFSDEHSLKNTPFPKVYFLPSDDAHISYKAPYHPSSESELRHTTFLRMHDFERDEKGYAKNKDFILDKSIAVFDDSNIVFVLDNKENQLDNEVNWIHISRQRTALFSARSTSTAPEVIREAVRQKSNAATDSEV